MKKISLFALAFALCLGLSACSGNAAGSSAASAASESASSSSASASQSASAGSEEAGDAGVTMQALMDANSSSVIKANYDSVLSEEKGSDGHNKTVYCSKDFSYDQQIDSEGTIAEYLDDGEDIWELRDVDGEKRPGCYFFAMSDEEAEALGMELVTPMKRGLLDANSLDETITSVVDNGDGTLTVVSSADSKLADLVADSYDYDGSLGLKGSEWSFEYVVDKETLALQRITEIASKDGAEVFRSVITIGYNANPPEGATKMHDMIDECRAADAGETRTVTVVYDAGTPQEEKYEKTVTKSAAVIPVYRSGYVYAYGDPDKKTEVPENKGGDITAYVFAEK